MKISRIFFTNLAILLMLLGSCELILRLAGKTVYRQQAPIDITVSPGGRYFERDSLLGYRHKAGRYTVTLKKEHQFVTTHDSTGLRLTSHRQARDLPEIWIFGCSFTHGWALDDEATFPWLLQNHWPGYRVINWGVSGYGSLHFLLQLRAALKSRRKPVLAIFNHADFHFGRNTFSFHRRKQLMPWNAMGIRNQPLATLDRQGKLQVQHSKVVYEPWWLARYLALANYANTMVERYLDAKRSGEEMDITRLIYDEVISLAEQHRFGLLLTHIGFHPEFIKDYSQKRNIPFLDIAVDLYQPAYNNQPYDSHPNALANQEYAAKLHHYLKMYLPTKELQD